MTLYFGLKKEKTMLTSNIRPTKFDEIIGQKRVIDRLKIMVAGSHPGSPVTLSSVMLNEPSLLLMEPTPLASRWLSFTNPVSK